MKKKTMIFDVSILAENLSACRGRSGIFFAAYNILKELVNKDTFDISLYCDTIYSRNFVDFVNDNFDQDIKIYFGNRFGKFLEKMEILNKKLREKHHNILKLLLNIFVRNAIIRQQSTPHRRTHLSCHSARFGAFACDSNLHPRTVCLAIGFCLIAT